MGGKSKVDETPQQRALAQYAMNQLRDYKQRWLPVQKQLAAQIQQQGAPSSYARQDAAGKNATDVAMSFGKGAGVLQKTLANNGVDVGSSKAKLALGGMGADEAKTRGLGAMITDQQMDDAYTQGLASLTAIGRGERTMAAEGLADRARSSARDSAQSAEISASERAGMAGMAGQAAGLGLYGALGRQKQPDAAGTGMGLPSGIVQSGTEF